jgi:hypothetical protein
MLKKIAVGIVTAAAMSCASAANWQPFFAGNDGSTSYVEAASLATRSGFARVWTYITYPTQQYEPSFGFFSSLRQQFLVDCKNRQFSLLQAQSFSGPELRGAQSGQLMNTDAQARAFLTDPAPGSMGESVVSLACAR